LLFLRELKKILSHHEEHEIHEETPGKSFTFAFVFFVIFVVDFGFGSLASADSG